MLNSTYKYFLITLFTLVACGDGCNCNSDKNDSTSEQGKKSQISILTTAIETETLDTIVDTEIINRSDFSGHVVQRNEISDNQNFLTSLNIVTRNDLANTDAITQPLPFDLDTFKRTSLENGYAYVATYQQIKGAPCEDVSKYLLDSDGVTSTAQLPVPTSSDECNGQFSFTIDVLVDSTGNLSIEDITFETVATYDTPISVAVLLDVYESTGNVVASSIDQISESNTITTSEGIPGYGSVSNMINKRILASGIVENGELKIAGGLVQTGSDTNGRTFESLGHVDTLNLTTNLWTASNNTSAEYQGELTAITNVDNNGDLNLINVSQLVDQPALTLVNNRYGQLFSIQGTRFFIAQGTFSQLENIVSYWDTNDSFLTSFVSTGTTIVALDDIVENSNIATVNNEVYSAGGFTSQGLVSNTLQKITFEMTSNFDPDSNNLPIESISSSSNLAALPTPTTAGCMVSIGSNLYLIGGVSDMNSEDATLSQTVVYNIETDEWTELTSLPTPIAGHACIVIDSKIYIFGGASAVDLSTYSLGTSASVSTKPLVYDPALDTWDTCCGTLPTPRTFFRIAKDDNNDLIYLIGGLGSDGNFLSSIDTLQY